jgi:hypothetical protein
MMIAILAEGNEFKDIRLGSVHYSADVEAMNTFTVALEYW